MADGTFMGMLTGEAGAMVRTGLHDRLLRGQEQWNTLTLRFFMQGEDRRGVCPPGRSITRRYEDIAGSPFAIKAGLSRSGLLYRRGWR